MNNNKNYNNKTIDYHLEILGLRHEQIQFIEANTKLSSEEKTIQILQVLAEIEESFNVYKELKLTSKNS